MTEVFQAKGPPRAASLRAPPVTLYLRKLSNIKHLPIRMKNDFQSNHSLRGRFTHWSLSSQWKPQIYGDIVISQCYTTTHTSILNLNI